MGVTFKKYLKNCDKNTLESKIEEQEDFINYLKSQLVAFAAMTPSKEKEPEDFVIKINEVVEDLIETAILTLSGVF